MIDLRTECHMITCNDSLVIPQKPEVEEVLLLGQRLVTLNFTAVSAEQNLHILCCTKVLPNKSLMISQTLLPYIISRLCSVASVSPTSYVCAHVVSLIAGYFFLPWHNSFQWSKTSLSRIHDRTQTHHSQ